MPIEDEEIKHCLKLAAQVYAERYSTPLLPGVAGRSLRALRGAGKNGLSETEALEVLVRKQRWALHRKKMVEVFCWVLWCIIAAVGFGVMATFLRNSAGAAFLFVLLAMLCASVLSLVGGVYLVSPIPLAKLALAGEGEKTTIDALREKAEKNVRTNC